jgi:hypothetical protein
LNAFLHSITYLSNKDINKQFDATLGNTNNAKFSLHNFLDFNPIKNNNKLHVYFCTNGIILDITFKFIVEYNIRLNYDCFYTSKKK